MITMKVKNECNASPDFEGAIRRAIIESQQFAYDQYGLEGSSNVNVFIMASRPDSGLQIAIPERFLPVVIINKIERLEEKIESLRRNLADLNRVFDDSFPYIPNYTNFYYYLEYLKNLLSGSGSINSRSHSVEERQITAKSILDDLRKFAKSLEYCNEFVFADLVKKIIDLFSEIEHDTAYVYHSISYLGDFRSNPYNANGILGTINIYYDTIRNSISPKTSINENDFGKSVLAHEFFHALNFEFSTRQKDGRSRWNSEIAYLAEIQRSAVQESLAKYFELCYAETLNNPNIVDKNIKIMNSNKFPGWGYAGAQIFRKSEKFQINDEGYLFKTVFHLSTFSMSLAFKLLSQNII